MLAWHGLGLGPRVIAAIKTLGFDEPTPIQRECMLPAIRDRRDIIGAAQTVTSTKSISMQNCLAKVESAQLQPLHFSPWMKSLPLP